VQQQLLNAGIRLAKIIDEDFLGVDTYSCGGVLLRG